MTKARCTRGFGIITDPETGEEINVEDEFETTKEQFERLDAAYSGMEIIESDDSCAHGDCSRTVTDSKYCWQHPTDDN